MPMITGYVHSIQSFGTVDGPGIRVVVFMQGCNLRCGCCHNPDTWACRTGKQYTAYEIIDIVLRYKTYFGADGGLTISGGEPLLQSDFVYEVFKLCHDYGINTCLDTSGSILNKSVKKLLEVTDYLLLDIKYTNEQDYLRYVGCSFSKPLEFLAYVNSLNIATTIRQVIIPTLNDSIDNVIELKAVVADFACVAAIELLPFRKLCQSKYDALGLEFCFSNLPEATDSYCTTLSTFL